MCLPVRIFIAVQLFHQGRLQLMPFPPMPYGMSNIGSPMGAPMPPGMMPAPMHMPMPMPMGPMPMGIPQPKLPIVVMPYYSKSKSKSKSRSKGRTSSKRHRRRRKKYSESDSCESESSDTSSSSDIDFRASTKHRSKGRGNKGQVLTPVVSYVTKDGYVVYQKKIKKEMAKDWLQIGKNSGDLTLGEMSEENHASEETRKLRFYKKKRNDH